MVRGVQYGTLRCTAGRASCTQQCSMALRRSRGSCCDVVVPRFMALRQYLHIVHTGQAATLQYDMADTCRQHGDTTREAHVNSSRNRHNAQEACTSRTLPNSSNTMSERLVAHRSMLDTCTGGNACVY